MSDRPVLREALASKNNTLNEIVFKTEISLDEGQDLKQAHDDVLQTITFTAEQHSTRNRYINGFKIYFNVINFGQKRTSFSIYS